MHAVALSLRKSFLLHINLVSITSLFGCVVRKEEGVRGILPLYRGRGLRLQVLHRAQVRHQETDLRFFGNRSMELQIWIRSDPDPNIIIVPYPNYRQFQKLNF